MVPDVYTTVSSVTACFSTRSTASVFSMMTRDRRSAQRANRPSRDMAVAAGDWVRAVPTANPVDLPVALAKLWLTRHQKRRATSRSSRPGW